jgi:rhodanese-related sulfurtransferase
MNRRRLLLTLAILCAAATTVSAAGCGGEPSGSEAPPAAPPAEPATTTAQGGGAEPSFTLQDDLYVGIDEVAAELERGADFVIVDSRPSADFAESHITGAISMPYYEVEQRFAELPKDTWIVAYCSCPTAEAEYAVELLREQGYEKTSVLLEGFPAWVESGYPVTAGPEA